MALGNHGAIFYEEKIDNFSGFSGKNFVKITLHCSKSLDSRDLIV